MTSTYIVAYPHPTIPPRERILPLELGSGARGRGLLKLLKDEFPNHSDDLKDATLWKAGRSTVARLPP